MIKDTAYAFDSRELKVIKTALSVHIIHLDNFKEDFRVLLAKGRMSEELEWERETTERLLEKVTKALETENAVC